MNSTNNIVDFLIVGAGATGLMMALLLHRRGFKVKVAERRTAPLAHSRSIGIHPPSLELLDELGLMNQFIEHGVSVSSGLALVNGDKPVALPMCSGAGTDRILIVPQQITEMLLESALQRDIVERGLQYDGHHEESSHLEVDFTDLKGNRPGEVKFRCSYLIAADGMYSQVRRNAGIGFEKYKYPWPYCMGDFPDTTDFGNRAVIFLSNEGLTESFPLPGGLRRWVINLSADDPILDDNRPEGVWHGGTKRQENFSMHSEGWVRHSEGEQTADSDKVEIYEPDGLIRKITGIETALGEITSRQVRIGTIAPLDLTERILRRTGYPLNPEAHSMFSVFRIYRGLVPELWTGRIVLAGDAAHVISPIGGQGMNMAWLNVRDLADAIGRFGAGEKAFSEYAKVVRQRFRKFANRAAFNTRIGRPGHPEWLLRLAVRALSSPMLRGITARRFTMR